MRFFFLPCYPNLAVNLNALTTVPVGYPSSVSSDYPVFYSWQFLQGLCSTVTGVLSSKAVLTGVGVGESTAAPVGSVLRSTQFFYY
jgi:hypothetical protein